MIKTKRIYDPRSPDDGYRLLVMRRWPRGIPKTAVNTWKKELGPSTELLGHLRNGLVSWAEYTVRYHEEMSSKRPLIAEARSIADQGDLTLLCSCVDEQQCHRTLLKTLIERPRRPRLATRPQTLRALSPWAALPAMNTQRPGASRR